MTALSEKAMLVRLSISGWSARKYDRKISEEVADQHGADRDVGRYNKCLVAQEAVKNYQKVSNEARIFHYENTLLWKDSGERILPAANFDFYSHKMREFKSKYEVEVRTFVYVYPTLKDQAKQKLNGLYNEADYPPASEIDRKFGFYTQIDPLPNEDDFRVALQNNDILKIREDIRSRVIDAEGRAMRDLWNRLHTCVDHMATTLKDPDAKFKNSMVGNITELCALLPRLNISGDPNLETMRKEVEAKLASIDPQSLRDNDYERLKAQQEADAILKAMSGYMG